MANVSISGQYRESRPERPARSHEDRLTPGAMPVIRERMFTLLIAVIK